MSMSHWIAGVFAINLVACGTPAAPSDPSMTTIETAGPASSASGAPVNSKGNGTAPKTCGGKAPAGGKSCTGDLRLGGGIPGHSPVRGMLRVEGTVLVVQLENCTCFGGTTIIPETDRVVLANVRKGMVDPSLIGKAVVVEWDMATGPTVGGADRGESSDVSLTTVSVSAAR